MSEKHRISPISDFHMTRRAVSRRVIPVPGCSTQVMAKIVFRLLGCETLNFSKSVNSFGLAVFFRNFLRSMLAIRVAKSPNEFETKKLDWTKGLAMTSKFPKFCFKNRHFARAQNASPWQKYARRRPPTCPKNTGSPRSPISI